MAKKPSTENEAYQQLKMEIKQNTLRSCYLFYGEEAYLREAYLAKSVKNFWMVRQRSSISIDSAKTLWTGIKYPLLWKPCL